jgi:uncharacterized lipoprotein NlpE involved in copper resistance
MFRRNKMKKIIAVLAAAPVIFGLGACRAASKGEAIDAAHNSRNSVNWDGTYTGTVPAADAEGINIQITLNTDETYEKKFEYTGKSGVFTEKGTFTWDEGGGVVILDVDGRKEPPYYQVGEGILIQLDMQGNLITGDLADLYVLRKISNEN